MKYLGELLFRIIMFLFCLILIPFMLFTLLVSTVSFMLFGHGGSALILFVGIATTISVILGVRNKKDLEELNNKFEEED